MTTAGQPAASELLAWLESRQDRLVELIERMTMAESPSDVPNAQAEIREIIATELERRECAVKRVPGRQSGGMLHARPAARCPTTTTPVSTPRVWPRCRAVSPGRPP